MKQVLKNKIINCDYNTFDRIFSFSFLDYKSIEKDSFSVEIIYMKDLLEKEKNNEILEKVNVHPAMWSEVYSPKSELQIFTKLFEKAINTWNKIHIVWITLKEEIEILEKYYESLWFFREDINCFSVDYGKVLISASVNIENLIWRWSDYKREWKKIFFNPPIREAGQVKACFKWINRWSIAWINIEKLDDKIIDFLQIQIQDEHILPITLSKVLNYNLEDLGFIWKNITFKINY